MYHLLAGVLLKIKDRKFLIATLKIDLFLCKNITSDIGFNVFLSTLSKKYSEQLSKLSIDILRYFTGNPIWFSVTWEICYNVKHITFQCDP